MFIGNNQITSNSNQGLCNNMMPKKNVFPPFAPSTLNIKVKAGNVWTSGSYNQKLGSEL